MQIKKEHYVLLLKCKKCRRKTEFASFDTNLTTQNRFTRNGKGELICWRDVFHDYFGGCKIIDEEPVLINRKDKTWQDKNCKHLNDFWAKRGFYICRSCAMDNEIKKHFSKNKL